MWRKLWEESGDPSIKNELIAYNRADCANLERLCRFITAQPHNGTLRISHTDILKTAEQRRSLFSSKRCVLEDFQYVTKCAYFDYQREHIFFRTHPHLRPRSTSFTALHRKPLAPNEVVHENAERCPRCKSKNIEPGNEKNFTILDLRFSKGHLKKWVTLHTYWDYQCRKCHQPFNPVGRIEYDKKYGPALIKWCVYCNVLRGQNMLQVNHTLRDAFNVFLQHSVLYRFKGYVASSFQGIYQELLKAVLASPVLHIDETLVNLRKDLSGYVWVLTSMDMVYYFYRPSREGAFLREMLHPFCGVLVSDFFAAYDSLPCKQQKCLLHMVREMNEDLLRSPFDIDLNWLVKECGSVLRSIIESVDRYGLKRRHLPKHQPAVKRFLDVVEARELASDVANKYKKRFRKTGKRMFTFLDHDGIPWNNTNAEHAIKLFAKYRRNADGRFTEKSVKDYLVLVSVFETCEFNDVNVLRFLLSGETTLNGLLRMARRRSPFSVQEAEQTDRP